MIGRSADGLVAMQIEPFVVYFLLDSGRDDRSGHVPAIRHEIGPLALRAPDFSLPSTNKSALICPVETRLIPPPPGRNGWRALQSLHLLENNDPTRGIQITSRFFPIHSLGAPKSKKPNFNRERFNIIPAAPERERWAEH